VQRLWKCLRPITCQSTRTHNSRRRLRRKRLWSGHLHVIRRRKACTCEAFRALQVHGFHQVGLRCLSVAACSLLWGWRFVARVSGRACTRGKQWRFLCLGVCSFHRFVRTSHQVGGDRRSGGLARPRAWGKLRACAHRLCFLLRPITCQSTRTHNSRRRLRRLCWWSGHFHVIWHWRRMFRVAAVLALDGGLAPWGEPARAAPSRRRVTLLGVARSHSGEPRANMAESKLRRRHGFGLAGRRSRPFASAGQALHVRRRSGGSLACGLATSEAMRAFPMPASRALHHGSYNWSANTDPQLQEAASPQGLWSGCLQRYVALPSHA